ncbi:MAG: polymer-forming cytoskeletal protein [Blastocatellia bacterium]|nr:polymer-forming cytoskeletal protein [Blastocatellia bacterium]
MKLVKTDSGSSDLGWIGRDIEVKGDILFVERLQIDGKVTGRLSSENGTLVVGDSGEIEAQVQVGVCVIHGLLHGDLVARSRVEIHRTGKVYGDVVTPVLLVEEGAMFNGAIKMSQEPSGRILEKVVPTESTGEEKRKIKEA